MKKIEQQMVDAVLNGKSFKKNGTRVIATYDMDGNYHSAQVFIQGNEAAHYYWSLSDRQWTIRLTDGLRRTPVMLSRLNALIQGVAKGGSRNAIYDILEPSKYWHYKMGANKYVWDGSHSFFAKKPTR